MHSHFITRIEEKVAHLVAAVLVPQERDNSTGIGYVYQTRPSSRSISFCFCACTSSVDGKMPRYLPCIDLIVSIGGTLRRSLDSRNSANSTSSTTRSGDSLSTSSIKRFLFSDMVITS